MADTQKSVRAFSKRPQPPQGVRICWTNLENGGPQLAGYLCLPDTDTLRDAATTDPPVSTLKRWLQSRVVNFGAPLQANKRARTATLKQLWNYMTDPLNTFAVEELEQQLPLQGPKSMDIFMEC